MLLWRKLIGVASSLALIGAFWLSCITVFSPRQQEKTKRELAQERIYKWTHPDDDFDLPLIFVGGLPRSGTTLMRTMLEVHPDIRCGPETHVIPSILLKRREWRGSEHLIRRLREAGVEPKALNIAIGRFIVEVVKNHAPSATYYCNKDPLALADMEYIHQIFPNSRFLFMIRDGRASAHSIISRKVIISNVDVTSYRSVLTFWNSIIKSIHKQCLNLGPNICLPVYYEKLVLQPVNTTKEIFNFLDIPWIPEVLHHEQHVNDTELSSFEKSTNQVQRPLYLDALTSWFGHIPLDVEIDMAKIAPMLGILGYNPKNPTPKYGEPDDFVLGKLKL